MSWKNDIIEVLATVKANTENHKGELKEFKSTFQLHVKSGDADVLYLKKKIEALQCSISNLICPHEKKMDELEERFDKKIFEDAEVDKEVAQRVSSLETARKYTWFSVGGLYTLSGVILKKLFS